MFAELLGFPSGELGPAVISLSSIQNREITVKTLILAAIRCSLMFTAVAVTSLFSVQPAQAYTVTLQQMGSNVVATGSGAINLTGLTPFGLTQLSSLMEASSGTIHTGQLGVAAGYTGFTGPTSFGSGGLFFADAGSGDLAGISNAPFANFIFVPESYVSNTALSSSATWNNATLASLGVTPGTYVWTWGMGANQRFTLRIGAVPDGGSTVSLLSFALLGLAALRRKLCC